MAELQTHVTSGDDVFFQAKSFFRKYQKLLIGVVVALVVIVGGWFAYQTYVVAPKQEQAVNSMFKAEQYYRQDSFKLALNGDKANRGFIYIINNYGSTKAANLAQYYAGVCYLKTGDFNNAVKYLSDFKTDAKQIQMMAYGDLADAYSELNKNDDAVTYYKKASDEYPDDDVMASEYLFRAALKLETMGKNDEALDLYKKLKADFPNSDRGYQADKYIYRLSIIPNDLSVK